MNKKSKMNINNQVTFKGNDEEWGRRSEIPT
jgi:hypothetical protein